jgi:hypothetical protein
MIKVKISDLFTSSDSGCTLPYLAIHRHNLICHEKKTFSSVHPGKGEQGFLKNLVMRGQYYHCIFLGEDSDCQEVALKLHIELTSTEEYLSLKIRG